MVLIDYMTLFPEFYVEYIRFIVLRHFEVFTAVMKADVNSGIQILAPWRFSLEGNGK